MRIFDAAQTAALLPTNKLVEALREVLRLHAAGAATAPPRTSMELPGGATLLLMPAATAELAITKIVTVHPANAIHGLPSVQAEVLVFDAATGRRLALLDGATVTARRTAAVSLLAAQLLAPRTDGLLLIVGAGAQARAHLHAFAEAFPLREVWIAARSVESAERLAAQARTLGLKASVAGNPTAVLPYASLIVTATTSATPVFEDTLFPPTFVAAVGAYRPDMAELPPALVRRARLYVDTLDGARQEAGDLLQAGVDWSTVTPLAAELPRPTGGPIVFKSVGHALWDLAAALAARTAF